ncbi:FYVE, RhoGEF and PH domain-containing protein 5b isoform X2 [Gouania willdenowi]|uniref:FYVE, RhoGEF and PH domain-containing protein 5-like n=1 Tax=Gouania willdenowi TaxID=441366 RepID=A0A8C5FYL6_GOUWI|nr:FYVE, RhoGEF and PH domain-containing protein 5-like isoform X2 [Gouania willdenowi]
MNSDSSKPSVAPKPRFVCHASLKQPPPLMPADKGLKPSIAPKPKVKPHLNGNEGGCSNGTFLTSDVDVMHQIENNGNRVILETLSLDKESNSFILKPPQFSLNGASDGEKEEDVIQIKEEGWRRNDKELVGKADSLDVLWVSGTRLTAVPEKAVEISDTDVTEDMDAEECDAGEALADTDGLSVGDFSLNSIDEDAGCGFAENPDKENNQKRLQVKEVHGLTEEIAELLRDDEGHFIKEDRQVFLSDDKEDEESAFDCGFTCNILSLRCGHRIKENVCPQGFVTKDPQPVTVLLGTSEGNLSQEPFYISSEDIINRESMLRNGNTYGLSERPLIDSQTSSKNNFQFSIQKHERAANTLNDSVTAGEYLDFGDNCCAKNKESEKATCAKPEEDARAVLNHMDSQQWFRQFSADTDTTLTSSLSESQLLSPNDSVFEDDLDGHTAPFLDSPETEEDISDDHVYEEPRKSSGVGNFFLLDRKAAGFQTRSRSQCSTKNREDVLGQFTPKMPMRGFGQTSLSSSPMLSSVRHLSYSKPHYLSLYPRSLSMEGQDTALCAHREESLRMKADHFSSDSFSGCTPLSSSGLSTPTSVVDIPPPFELAYITKRPITKSSPSLLMEGDSAEKNRKKKSSIKRFLMLKLRWKTENKPALGANSSSFKPPGGSNSHTPRLLNSDRHGVSTSPQLSSRLACKPQVSPGPTSHLIFSNETRRKENSVAFLTRSVIRVESFEDRSRVPFLPLPLTKPRSISFPNTDTSDYENVPTISSDYENLQVPKQRPVCQPQFTDFFDRPCRVLSSANETDGYVDMSSLPGFEKKSSQQEAESAYTEAYNVCSAAVAPPTSPVCAGERMAEEDHGRTSEEEEGVTDNYERQVDGRSRAFYIVKELMDTERLHTAALKLLQEDFRRVVGSAVGDEGEPVLREERLREILNELPDVYILHCMILTQLENRITHWEESPRIADIFLSRKAEFLVFTTYIGHYDRSMSLLEDSCQTSPAFAAIVQQFEVLQPSGQKTSLKHQLLQIIVRVAQYRMVLTDYLNNLSPDSKEYEDTQAALAFVSDIADQVNDSLKHGKNLLRLVNIEYSVRGLGDLLQPGRMNDVLLYTYPQQDGKYRLKNNLPLSELKVSKPTIENVQNALRIEGTEISITLSASSFIEREDWFFTLNRSVTERTRGSAAFICSSGEARELHRFSLGEKAPTLVPVSQVTMCMNCTADFSLTLRRHHCHSCGRIVCRSCSRNRYPLKYMKDRMAKVCDHCYSELNKRGNDSALSDERSPQIKRSTRPLSAVFQNIHPPNIWRHRKGTLYFNQQVSVSEEGSISGTLHRSKKSKRNWKRLWFLLKDKVLYTYRGQEERVASETLPLLGFTVKLPERMERDHETNIFQLYHKNTLFYTFKAEDNYTAQRWVDAMEEATVL